MIEGFFQGRHFFEESISDTNTVEQSAASSKHAIRHHSLYHISVREALE